MDENYKQMGSTTKTTNSIQKLSPFSIPNYAILELNLLLKSTGWLLKFAPESKATLSIPTPSFDYYYHMSNNDSPLLNDLMLFDLRWNSFLSSLIQSKLVVKEVSLVWDMECGTSGGSFSFFINNNNNNNNNNLILT